MVELALARLRSWSPRVRTWGLSATLANTDTAMRVLLGRPADRMNIGTITSDASIRVKFLNGRRLGKI